MRILHLAAPMLAVALVGCPQDIDVLDQDGGAADGGATVVDSGEAGDGGDVFDGGASSDAGVPPGVDAGVLARFRWTRVTLPENTRTLTSVWGRGSNEVYFGTSTGGVLRFDGTGVEEIWDAPNNTGVRHIDGTAGRVFVAADRELHVFEGAPTGTPAQSLVTGNDIGGLAVVADDLAFLASEKVSSRALFRYDGASVTELGELEVASINGVWAEPGPTAWVASNGRMPVFDGLGLTEDTVEWPAGWSSTDIAYFFVKDIVGLGAYRLAVGSGGGVLNDESGSWRFERAAEGTADFAAVAAVPGGAPESAVAVGDEVAGARIHWRTADGWVADDFGDRVTLLDVWAAGPDEIYAVGGATGSLDGALLRGTRQR